MGLVNLKKDLLFSFIVDVKENYRRLFKRLVRTPYLTRSRTIASFGPKIPFAMYDLDQKLSKYLDFRDGYFVEAGAFDGLRGSNTKFLELYRGWNGALVEPLPEEFLKLKKNRSKKTARFQKALVSFEFDHDTVTILSAGMMSTVPHVSNELPDAEAHAKAGRSFLGGGIAEEIEVPTSTLNDLLKECNAPKIIDFMSLDVEGNELAALQGLDHSEFRFRYILVEAWAREKLLEFLGSKGYVLVDDFGGDLLLHDSGLP